MNASGEALGSTEDKGLSAGASLWFGWVFALTTLTGAFLLFQVQPVICKFILPWFGGGPAVWTTCMLFFQTVLFAGYAYAHFSASTLPTKLQVPLHILLLIAAVLCLPILPRDSWRPTLEGDPVWHIFLLLSICVGLPYLVLASTGPLVQSWFAKASLGVPPTDFTPSPISVRSLHSSATPSCSNPLWRSKHNLQAGPSSLPSMPSSVLPAHSAWHQANQQPILLQLPPPRTRKSLRG